MGRESSHGTKELFNPSSLVLKARHLAKWLCLQFSAGTPVKFACAAGNGMISP